MEHRAGELDFNDFKMDLAWRLYSVCTYITITHTAHIQQEIAYTQVDWKIRKC